MLFSPDSGTMSATSTCYHRWLERIVNICLAKRDSADYSSQKSTMQWEQPDLQIMPELKN